MQKLPDYLTDLETHERRPSKEAQGVLYRALYRVAQRGDPCPTTDQLMQLCGASSNSTVIHHLTMLERRGMIRIARFPRSREVTVMAIGKTTRPCTNRSKHPRYDSIRQLARVG